MPSITTALAAVLRAVRRPGDFYASGTTMLPTPSLEVEGVGPIALPLLPLQAEQLIAVAQRAPYGRGQDTIIDTGVRRTWQIGADQVRIGGKHWPSTLADIVARAADGLGVTDPVTAELYKLLIYDQGSFFVSHRDTEKTPGMFATLVVVLPSLSSGGELVVRHHDREVRLELRCDDPSEATFAAFYADCPHEVLPVTAGCRLTLVYNLLRRGKGAAPEAPRYDREQTRVETLLRSWAAAEPGSDDRNPTKLVYKLEHAYTPAELGFAALKGADAAAAGVLVGAAARAGCDLHLALLTIEESGPAEYTGYDRRRRGRWSDGSEDDDDYDVVEISDRDVTLSDWRRPDGTPSTLSDLPADTDSELSPPDALEDAEPDEQHFHEATGNEGASFERTYRHAAFVLWPSRRVLAVLNQGGLQLTLPYLTDLTERWSTCSADERSARWAQAHELAGHILSTWPRHPAYGRQDESVGDATRLLTLLTRLGDTDRIDDFLADVAASGLCGKADNAAILAGLALLAPARAVALVERIIEGTAPTSLGMCGDLLSSAGAALPQVDPVALRTAATILLDALPGDPARAAPHPVWQYGPRLSADFIVDSLVAFGRIDPALAMRAVDHMLAWPKTYTLDGFLVPAIRKLMGSATMQTLAARRLRTACLDHLHARTTQTLEAPRDWRRANLVGCQCAHCLALSQFLADPAQKEWVLRAAAAQRAHVESTIKTAGCDLDMTTVRRGSPHSLVCTKNQASYERRVKQRENDLVDIQRLEG
jgi:predicted 2-oxoglutarate/Fe(II)-dependent dioxygenase YbiX